MGDEWRFSAASDKDLGQAAKQMSLVGCLFAQWLQNNYGGPRSRAAIII
jgi:hypothetical protein